jgi:hypothetical protein
MPVFEFVGGSKDGQLVNLPDPIESGHEVRVSAEDNQFVEQSYRLGDDGRFHFARYEMKRAPQHEPQIENALNEELKQICGRIMPFLAQLEHHCHRRGGFPDIHVNKWLLRRVP